jgi:hypothetical protein
MQPGGRDYDHDCRVVLASDGHSNWNKQAAQLIED